MAICHRNSTFNYFNIYCQCSRSCGTDCQGVWWIDLGLLDYICYPCFNYWRLENIETAKITQLINTTQDVGYKSVQWNATNSFSNPVSAGVYLYQIRAGEFVQTKKMVVLK